MISDFLARASSNSFHDREGTINIKRSECIEIETPIERGGGAKTMLGVRYPPLCT